MKALLAVTSDPAALTLQDVEAPSPGQGEVLVAVHAAAVTTGELEWPETWPAIPAHDVSGVVAETGEGVSGLTLGDEVCGLIDFDRPGAAAEFVVVSAGDLVVKPLAIDRIAASALPLAGLTAWQALVDHASVTTSQHVLVHGGAGAVGGCCVQLAVYLGAHVTATASSTDTEFVMELGASGVIDYRTRFEDQVGDVDVVIDTVGSDVLHRSWTALRPGGILVSIAEPLEGGVITTSRCTRHLLRCRAKRQTVEGARATCGTRRGRSQGR